MIDQPLRDPTKSLRIKQVMQVTGLSRMTLALRVARTLLAVPCFDGSRQG